MIRTPTLILTAALAAIVLPAAPAAAGNRQARAIKIARKLIKLPRRTSKAHRVRLRTLAAWEKVRGEALRVIFDKTIYPDANHGRSGQARVDAAVDRVRAVYPALQRLLAKDARKLLRLSPADAKTLLGHLQRTQLPADVRCLLQARAGDTPETAEVGPWTARLARYLSDETVAQANAWVRGTKPQDGVLPTATELKQVQVTNAYRRLLGRRALRIDCRLVEAARDHCADMTRLGFFAHSSPIQGKVRPADRMRRAGYPTPGGENLSLGRGTAKGAHLGWTKSSGHHRNLLTADYTTLGSGQDGKHWAQNFGR